MKLLHVIANNFKNCNDSFEIDFVSKSKKTAEDKEYEPRTMSCVGTVTGRPSEGLRRLLAASIRKRASA